MNRNYTNVLIAGAGPVGLAMAADLARYGVSVRLIEKSPARTDKSKALVLWSRTLELMDRMDCSAPFLATGRKTTTVNITAGKEPIGKIEVAGEMTPHPYALMIPQSDTERLMGDFVTSLGVKIERNIELTNFVASADGVTSTLRHLDGTEETFESGWLIGCDGAHSTVRHKLGMEFAGETMPSSWIIADIHLSKVPNPEEMLISWHAEGILALFPVVVPRYRGTYAVRRRSGESHHGRCAGNIGCAWPRRHHGLRSNMAYGIHHQRTQGFELSFRPGICDGRCSTHPQPGRWARDEHRDTGRVQSCLEAGPGESRYRR
jgi:2-polyprenyl-6-methoxyphenol hydroxylase-like FAD-dependent oxidoreductase